MRFIERKILETLIGEAAKRDYYPHVIEAYGVDEEDGRVSQDRMQLRVIIEQADAWDADSIITFRHAEEDEWFWVHMIWGNGEYVIHDYQVHTDADIIVGATTKEIES